MISFIVPVKNQLYYTKAILEEIQTKCPYKFEIIFINDNSTDDTEAFLSLIENEDIKVITNKENVGVNNSRNK
jgi:glycosyltransferase involved in cell wall biosynthesis